MVFTEISGPSTQPPQAAKQRRKVKERGDLEDEFGTAFRPNEGEAAQHGVFFDDTEYDYMQHMRDLGAGGGAVTWVEAPSAKNEKAKGKMKLEDALRGINLQDDDLQSHGGMSVASSRSLMPEDMLPSEFVRKTTYQDMQDVPDTIAGFQPDMDPRLREVLEALEDEAYVDDEDDIFQELTGDAEELDRDEWGTTEFDEEGSDGYVDDDDEGWQSDDTIKAGDSKGENLPPPSDTAAPPPSDPSEGAWMEEFTKFKQDVKAAKAAPKKVAHQAPSDAQSINTGLSSLASGRRKKRKGAMTSTSGYSMSSSALVRTDAQSLLDQRFDKIEEAYNEDNFDDDYGSQFDDAESMVSGMSGMSGMSRASAISSYSRVTDSEAPQLVRSDFDSIMDGFLAGHSRAGNRGRHIKKSGFQTGMEQLDEIRFGLGPARLGKSARASK